MCKLQESYQKCSWDMKFPTKQPHLVGFKTKKKNSERFEKIVWRTKCLTDLKEISTISAYRSL